MGDRKRSRVPAPADGDERYRRTCTRCYEVRDWTECFCSRCGNPEFMLPEAAAKDTAALAARKEL